MIRTTARLLAPFLATVWMGAACGGRVVFDGSVAGTTTGVTASSAGGAGTGGAGSTGNGGCDSASHTIDVAAYDLSCNTDSDCVSAFLGDFCSECRCPLAAINVVDGAKYQAEAQALEADAPPGGCFCPASEPICNAGQCDAKVP